MTDNFTDSKEALERLIIPDDITEFIESYSQSPNQEALARIEHRTLRMVQSEPNVSRRCRFKLWQVMAAAAAIILLFAGIGPNSIAGAVNRLLVFIPGFGISSSQNVNLFAPNPVRAEKDGIKIDINGVLADSKGTSLMAYAEGGTVDLNSSYLLDSAGVRYPYQSGNMVVTGSGNTRVQTNWAWYKALPADLKQVALVVPSLSDWTINIPLTAGKDSDTAENFGPAVTVNNVTVAAQSSSFPDETKVTLLVQSLRGGVPEAIEGATVENANGSKSYLLKSQAGYVGSGLIYFSTSPNLGDRLDVTIPSVSLLQDVHADITLPVPGKNSTAMLNNSLNLGTCSLTLTKAEALNQDNQDWLRIYITPDLVNGAIVNGMLNNLSVNGKAENCMGEFDPSTGGIKWLQIPYPAGETSIKLTIGKIDVLVKGPWKLKVPVKQEFN
ncbi:hypothetical protein REC12_06260 [Desulfosporosinus sp. PR]|uniref:hypothetical protein n=1 Tax=Candidatus Desulfosporosinus nitrosoreducens TaxID=3401928 RepID=UPI0027FCE83A|nr:hypothetical protein [Desulfosporosinus sp. PR]MDQ7093188.1 hypothetical protein [Desulfosporosinus sp. PR]